MSLGRMAAFAACVALGCASAPVAHDATSSIPESLVFDAGPPVAPIDAGNASALDSAPLPAPDDALEALFSRQINFKGSEPTVTVRLMEGQSEVTFIPRSTMRLRTRGSGEKTLAAPPGSRWVVRIAQSEPGALGYAVQVAEFKYAEKDAVAASRALWEGRGFAVRVLTEGSVFGIAGHLLDNRRSLVLLGAHTPKADAQVVQDQVAQQFAEATQLHTTLLKRPHGTLEIIDEWGAKLGLSDDLIVVDDERGEGFQVKQVEHDTGYASHGREDRQYRGALLLTFDAAGKLAVINAVPLEELLRGLVPAEIFSNAPAEALKSQAVTARGEVLAKIGVRHLTDPYLFCADQHCQAYKGEGSETPTTDAAIRATAGEALFRTSGGPLVDTVYSAICGGYTESNEKVWAGQPDPALRGVPDVIGPLPHEVPSTGISSDGLGDFLGSKASFACRIASFGSPARFRWKKAFTAGEVDALVASLRIGHVVAISVTERGASGRAVALTLSGDQGAGEIRGELNIRRTFKNLPSAMFLVASQSSGSAGVMSWTFSGGGWGHGVGMCQIGAIGRAESGQSYRQILQHYFQDSELVKVY